MREGRTSCVGTLDGQCGAENVHRLRFVLAEREGCHRTRNMEKTLTITTHEAQSEADRAYWRQRTPEERLDAVERLRLEAGKFLYEYPARLRRVLEIAGNAQS